MNIEKLLDDPFIIERLNPLFLQEARKYQGLGLRFFIFRKLLQPIYLKYVTPKKGTVFFLSTISSDGIGDFIALHKCAELLQDKAPKLDVKIGYTTQRTLPEWPSKLETYIFFDRDYLIEKIVEGLTLPDYQEELKNVQEDMAKNLLDYEVIKAKSPLAAQAIEEYHYELQEKTKYLQKNKALKEMGEQFYQDLINSRAIVNISLALNTFENPLLAGKSLYFSETGNFQGIPYAEKLNWYSMGLLPFEEGIFLKHAQSSAASKQNQYVSYITTISNAKLSYIYLICELQKVRQDDIEIILFPLTEDEIANLNSHHLQKLGISQIIIDGNVKGIDPKGKTLILKQELPVAYDTFINLIKQSETPIGCTGDLSLSEVIGYGKTPFYEMRGHKMETIASLMHIAEFLQLDAVHAYFTHLKEVENANPIQLAEKLATLLQSPQFAQQWEKLSHFIHRYYCFEDTLLSTLNAFFAYQDKPGWKQQEQELIASDLPAEKIYEQVIKKTAS